MLLGHGGNIGPEKIIDFSSNINPLGFPPAVKDFIVKNIHLISRYPDPECKSARQSLSSHLGISSDNILLSNGSNELIHLIPRALSCRTAVICRPGFSEYELSVKLSGAKIYHVLACEKDNFCIDINKIKHHVCKGGLVILCNPNNPTGYLFEKLRLLDLADFCSTHKAYLIVDEAFMEFVDGYEKISLLKEALYHKYLLVLRSLTKFFGLPGLRIGYLVANKNLIRKISLFEPTWSVNGLAQGIVGAGLFDAGYIKRSSDYIRKEGDFLFNRLKEITGIYPYRPAANFIFCKILDKRLNPCSLSMNLLKSGIFIRDCSNFKGLRGCFFRVAVKKRQDNLYLIACLKKIFK